MASIERLFPLGFTSNFLNSEEVLGLWVGVEVAEFWGSLRERRIPLESGMHLDA